MFNTAIRIFETERLIFGNERHIEAKRILENIKAYDPDYWQLTVLKQRLFSKIW
jgi:hemerythrin superfamily protein